MKVITKLEIPDSFDKELIDTVTESLGIIVKSPHMYQRIFNFTKRHIHDANTIGLEQGKLEAIKFLQETQKALDIEHGVDTHENI